MQDPAFYSPVFPPRAAQFMYFLVVSHHLLSLFFLLSSSTLFSTSLFPSLLRYRSLLLAILAFMLLIPICPLFLLRIERLVAHLLSNIFSHIITRNSNSIAIFSMTKFVIILKCFNFYFFIISFFCPSNTFLFACTFTPRYFSSSTTSILFIFSQFSFVLNRMHWLFYSICWRPY